jgi:hypothetical protein
LFASQISVLERIRAGRLGEMKKPIKQMLLFELEKNNDKNDMIQFMKMIIE